MVIDAHLHIRGGESGERILRAMDEAGIAQMVILSEPPHRIFPMRPPSPGEPAPHYEHRIVIDDLARIVAPDPERLLGFAWIEPTLPDAAEAVGYAFGDKGLRGAKMMPYHWYPRDERAQACYAQIESYGRPVLFHTGALWGYTETSEFCRPVYAEIFLHYPKLRVALCHIGWPWTDECLAVCGKFRAATRRDPGREWSCFVEISTGAPRIWKVEALRKALAYLGDGRLIYGSDLFEPENPQALRRHLELEVELLREAGASPEAIERILSGNAQRWLGAE